MPTTPDEVEAVAARITALKEARLAGQEQQMALEAFYDGMKPDNC